MQLMDVVHGGVIWMDTPMLIDVDLIAEITCFPTNGEKPEQYSLNKTKEKALVEEMKKNFSTLRGARGLIINRISEPVTILSTQLME
jgi:hypothetical protein